MASKVADLQPGHFGVFSCAFYKFPVARRINNNITTAAIAISTQTIDLLVSNLADESLYRLFLPHIAFSCQFNTTSCVRTATARIESWHRLRSPITVGQLRSLR